MLSLEIDPKAGGGKSMTIGEMAKSMLLKLEWFDTRFPRIPVNVQKQIDAQLNQRRNPCSYKSEESTNEPLQHRNETSYSNPLSRDSSETSGKHDRSYSRDRKSREHRSRSRERRDRDRSNDRGKRDREKDHKSHRRSRSRSREQYRNEKRITKVIGEADQ